MGESSVSLVATVEDASGSPITYATDTAGTVKVDYDGAKVVFAEGDTETSDEYASLQFHFHSPSEHTVNGVQFGAEMHLVNAQDPDKYLVIGLLLEGGAAEDHPFIE